LDGTGPRRNDLYALILTGGVQDIVVEDSPEPAQLTLAGLAMLALAGALKRRRVRKE
jgi:LPXTG-motif cell wall-anchored protein